MFGVFGQSRAERQGNGRYAANSQGKCVHFHRESAGMAARIFVEVRDFDDHTIYISNQGVTPSYLNKPYDDWCRDSLTASYVFASLDSAVQYFKGRQSELSKHLMEAIAEQIRL